ncbi:MAG: CHAT domain-containing protein [Undibacterium sp.]|nr:CHAT domain-containing protein [Undibacterium sp.]
MTTRRALFGLWSGVFSGWLGCACLLFSQLTQAQDIGSSATTPAASYGTCQSSFLIKLQLLRARYQTEGDQAMRGAAALELALHLQQMGRYQEAYHVVQEALNQTLLPLQRAHALVALGNIDIELGRRDLAEQAYRDAIGIAPGVAEVTLSVALNQLGLLPAKQISTSALKSVENTLQQLPDDEMKARFLVQYILQAKRSGAFTSSYLEQNLEQALLIANSIGSRYLQIEILDQQAQLFEERERDSELMAVSDRAILLLQQIDAPELMIAIEARRGRVFTRHQQIQNAIKSFQAAARYIREIRQDIPVSYAQGRSSLREIIDPVYLGLADALLKQSEQSKPAERAMMLYQVRDVIEEIKQNQFDDYLGNHCSTSAANSASEKSGSKSQDLSSSKSLRLAAGTAVLYPIIFPDRLELLLETSDGIVGHSVAINAEKLNQDVMALSSALRANHTYQTLSRRLHRVLLAPLEQELSSRKIANLVIVPDGVLRLLAFAALHDGKQYAIEKYAIAISPGLRIIAQQGPQNDPQRPDAAPHTVLLAGLSEPGAVVERLPDELVDQLLQEDETDSDQLRRSLVRQRALRNSTATTSSAPLPQQVDGAKTVVEDAQLISEKLKHVLRLDGVQAEITSLHQIVHGRTMLNQEFTSSNFAQQVRSGQFDIVHVASHGIFGSSAEKTFILAHDEPITIDQFQTLLSADGLNIRPLDLLILSACETAEGDDRAPLGISGAALKAKARSAIGSLWPVSDLAANQLMQRIYENYINKKLSKAQSLRLAQLDLMRQALYAHPSYWAAFILVGSW